ncbi:hypothetical protein MTO96_007221 [Rhipicephalus appendiculatus]
MFGTVDGADFASPYAKDRGGIRAVVLAAIVTKRNAARRCRVGNKKYSDRQQLSKVASSVAALRIDTAARHTNWSSRLDLAEVLTVT